MATAIGDRTILSTQTLLLADGEVGRFEVSVGGQARLPVTVQFGSPDAPEQNVEWAYEAGVLALAFSGCGRATWGGSTAPQRIGDYYGRSLHFRAAFQRLGQLNQVTVQFSLEGEA